jgi:hypothetical protein
MSVVDRGGSVGIGPRCALDGPGIEYRWGLDYLLPSIPGLKPIQPPVQRVMGFIAEDKAARACR